MILPIIAVVLIVLFFALGFICGFNFPSRAKKTSDEQFDALRKDVLNLKLTAKHHSSALLNILDRIEPNDSASAEEQM